MKQIPFNENARDVWHDASVEVPDDHRGILAGSADGSVASTTACRSWPFSSYTHWRELPAPPKPTPKIVPHSLEHWHDPKVERPEDGKHFIGMHKSGYVIHGRAPSEFNWVNVNHWTYAPETSR